MRLKVSKIFDNFDQEIESLNSIIIDFQSHENFFSYQYDHEIESLKSIIFDI